MASDITPLGIQRIEKRLEPLVPLLDMDDYANRPTQIRVASLSRALAAYCVQIIGGADPANAAKAITDRFHDRGIDAIYYDQRTSQLLLVQAKWASGISWRDAGEFVDGARKLVTADWEAFRANSKIYDRRNEIDTALRSAAKIVFVTVHNGSTPAEHVNLKRVSDMADEIDGGSGLASCVHWHQQDLLEALHRESEPPKVNADLYISNWGQIQDPYYALFGRVQGEAISQLWKRNPHLAHMNLRDYSRRSDVNIAIGQTAREEPHHFWYFNNGLTIICESIAPAIYGRLQNEVALFHLEGISLVNGAQTTGIVADNFDHIPESQRANLWIQIRVIAVRNCPDDFAKRVTKFTNLQNAISVQDFLSLDPIHSRIATDFAVEKRKYAFRWGGEGDPTGEQGCTLREATVALACAHPDPSCAVQAKREISVLWDTDSTRYQEIFYPELTATKIWNAVKIMRTVDRIVNSHESDSTPKADMVANHLQRIVLHIVFQDPQISGWETTSDISNKLLIVETLTQAIFEKVRKDVVEHHPYDYLASLSKNVEKCRSLVARIRLPSAPTPGPAPTWLPMFDEDPR